MDRDSFLRAISRVMCLHGHKAMFYGLANAARVKSSTAQQRCKPDIPLPAEGVFDS